MVRWGGGGGFAHLDHHRDVRPSRTEDYRQNGYENHPTTSARVESETPTSRERLEVSESWPTLSRGHPWCGCRFFTLSLRVQVRELEVLQGSLPVTC